MKAAEEARQKAAAIPVETKLSAEDAKSAQSAEALEIKKKNDLAAKELADTSEKQLADIRSRRAAAEAEALAIRDMMSAPARVLKAPSEVAAEDAKKGTLHKPLKAEGADDKKKAPTKVGGKLIKSSETSSTWQEEGAKRAGGLKTRGDSSGGIGGGWRAGGAWQSVGATVGFRSVFVRRAPSAWQAAVAEGGLVRQAPMRPPFPPFPRGWSLHPTDGLPPAALCSGGLRRASRGGERGRNLQLRLRVEGKEASLRSLRLGRPSAAYSE